VYDGIPGISKNICTRQVATDYLTGYK